MIAIRATSALTAATLLGLLSYAQAQSIPPEGELHVTFTSTQVPPGSPMPTAVGEQYVQTDSIMTAKNDQGNPILNNMGGRCQFGRLLDGGGKPIEQHGYCTYSDNGGDQIFEKCDFLPGKPNTCALTGGTGKFAGLQASIIISVTPIKSTYAGTAQLVGHKDGTYKIVKTN